MKVITVVTNVGATVAPQDIVAPDQNSLPRAHSNAGPTGDADTGQDAEQPGDLGVDLVQPI